MCAHSPMRLPHHHGLFSQKKHSSLLELLYLVSCHTSKEVTNVGTQCGLLGFLSPLTTVAHAQWESKGILSYNNLKLEDNKKTIQE